MNTSPSQDNPVYWGTRGESLFYDYSGLKAEVWTPGYQPMDFFPQDISITVELEEDREAVLNAMMKEIESSGNKLRVHLNSNHSDFRFWSETLKKFSQFIESYSIKSIDDQEQEYYDKCIEDLSKGSPFAITYQSLGFSVASVQQFKDRWGEIKEGLFKKR